MASVIKKGSTIDKALKRHRVRKKKKKATAGAGAPRGNGNGPRYERQRPAKRVRGDEPFDAAFLKRIASLTHENSHTEVRAMLAERTGRPRVAEHLRAMRVALDDIDIGKMGISVPGEVRSKIFQATEALRSAVDKAMTPEQRKSLSGHW